MMLEEVPGAGTDTVDTEGGGAPRDLPTLRDLIAERRALLPKRLVQAAEFALSHPRDVAFGTIAEIARAAEVQPSALVRFAQALGYAGFSDLQAVFRAHARERWPDYRERLETIRGAASPDRNREGSDWLQALLAGFAQASAASVARLADTVNAGDLERAVTTLAAARSIHLIGARRSYPAVAGFAYALRKLGVACHLIDQTGGPMPEQADLIPPDDAVFAVSFTPYAPVTIDLATRAAQRGVPVVAVTDTVFSPLAQVATVWLEVAEADHAAFRLLSGTFALTMTLAVAVAERRRDREAGDPDKP
jgi:DNA-binding MurR/RpiR family transcriptional regulator